MQDRHRVSPSLTIFWQKKRSTSQEISKIHKQMAKLGQSGRELAQSWHWDTERERESYICSVHIPAYTYMYTGMQYMLN